MGQYGIHIDSFSGGAAALGGRHRTSKYILMALYHDPRVSTFDMSEHRWLCNGINELKKEGLIVELEEPYPWHRFKIIEAKQNDPS